MKPAWIDYFLATAKLVSSRSHDIHTQHGCVITDKQHSILGVGYNGFPKGMCDKTLPTNRPDKYHWMIHAERNALSNCVIRPDGGIAYITGQPCNDCIMALWQEGISEVHIIDGHGTKLFDQEAKNRFDLFIKQTGMKIYKHTPNFSWIKEINWD